MTDLSGFVWRRSSRSTGGGNCVELAPLDDGRVAVRDSKNPDGPVLLLARADLDAWLTEAKGGVFDFPA